MLTGKRFQKVIKFIGLEIAQRRPMVTKPFSPYNIIARIKA